MLDCFLLSLCCHTRLPFCSSSQDTRRELEKSCFKSRSFITLPLTRWSWADLIKIPGLGSRARLSRCKSNFRYPPWKWIQCFKRLKLFRRLAFKTPVAFVCIPLERIHVFSPSDLMETECMVRLQEYFPLHC